MIAARARRYWELHVTIASTAVAFLKAVHAEAGSPGSVTFRPRSGALGKKPIGAWHMAGRTAAVFLETIRPWIRMKRDNVTTALQFYAVRSRGGGKHEMSFLQVLHQTLLAQRLRKENAASGRSKPIKYNPLVERFGKNHVQLN